MFCRIFGMTNDANKNGNHQADSKDTVEHQTGIEEKTPKVDNCNIL